MSRTSAIVLLALLVSACGTRVDDVSTSTAGVSEPASPTTTTVEVPDTTLDDSGAEESVSSGTSLAPASTTTTTTIVGATVLEVVVVPGEVADLRAALGDDVILTVYSDEVDEVHVHTYDLHADVAPGDPAVIEFAVDIPGIFEIEFEGSGALIAELRVDP